MRELFSPVNFRNIDLCCKRELFSCKFQDRYIRELYSVNFRANIYENCIVRLISGLFTITIVFILRFPNIELEDVADQLDWIFLVLFPHYGLGVGFAYLYINKENMQFCQMNLPKVGLCTLYKRMSSPHPCCPGM